MPLKVLATDLPIDISHIGQNRMSDDAITPRYNIDLLTRSSRSISEAINASKKSDRDEITLTLFTTTADYEAADINHQIESAVVSLALFSSPTNYSAISGTIEASAISTWLVILVLTVCAGIGFVLSQTLRTRRKRREAVVH